MTTKASWITGTARSISSFPEPVFQADCQKSPLQQPAAGSFSSCGFPGRHLLPVPGNLSGKRVGALLIVGECFREEGSPDAGPYYAVRFKALRRLIIHDSGARPFSEHPVGIPGVEPELCHTVLKFYHILTGIANLQFDAEIYTQR